MLKREKNLFYGPVPSRRFGFSLGIDPVPYKTCSFDCIYCQLGRTTIKTAERKRYKDISMGYFIAELDEKIKSAGKIDYITFAGSGEPTLNSDIGAMIDSVKKITDIPVAVLTNGSLLHKEDVAKDLLNADLIKISLDACNENVFKKINQPDGSITFDDTLNGIKMFLENYAGRVWLEIMLLKNINDNLSCASEFRNLMAENNIADRVEKIHINTPVRPSGLGEVFAPTAKNIKYFEDFLNEAFFKNSSDKKAEVIKPFRHDKIKPEIMTEIYEKNKKLKERIIELLKRRPVTTEDISISLGENISEVIKILEPLLKRNEIRYRLHENTKYYYC